MKNPRYELAKKKGFLVYMDREGIMLLERGIHSKASVFVERLRQGRYKAHYTRWTEEGDIQKETILVNDGKYEECFRKAVSFTEWIIGTMEENKPKELRA